ncbi:MAG: sporulation protein YqfD [Clostridia bacterium]|nr:sporulation protein YqfD [Clostridia bacterium]
MIGLLKFIRGTVRFKITGSRPGAFLNKLIRSGVGVYGIKSRAGEIYVSCILSDYKEVLRISKDSSCRVHSVKKQGIPIIFERNKRRSGLVWGAVCFLLIFKLLSMYIWTIDICRFETMSQTAACDILRRVGMYEGVKGEFESLKRMQTSAMIEFGNLSWITINADGSNGEVNATEKLPPATFDNAPRNLKAKTDAQIIRVDTYNGTPVVSMGDGAAKGDLLISGVVENADGTVNITHAEGKVTAATRYNEVFVIPKIIEITNVDDTPVSRCSVRLFNVIIPLTLKDIPENSAVLRKFERVNIQGSEISADIITENNYKFSVENITVTKDDADKIMRKQMLLRELFKCNDTQIVTRDIADSECDDSYIYTVNYDCIENIAAPQPILIDNVSALGVTDNE